MKENKQRGQIKREEGEKIEGGKHGEKEKEIERERLCSVETAGRALWFWLEHNVFFDVVIQSDFFYHSYLDVCSVRFCMLYCNLDVMWH